MGGQKIEMPLFMGNDSKGWFYRSDIYFSLYPYSDQEKLQLSILNFESKALKWFKW